MSFELVLKRLGFKDRMPKFYHVDKVLGQGDEFLIVTALTLTAFGVVMVYSASYYVAEYHFFFRQLFIAMIGLVVMAFGMFTDPLIYRRWIKVGLLAIVILMTLRLFTPIGPSINNTRRWLNLGIVQVQSSEIARCMLIVYIARYMADYPEIGRKFDRDLGYLMITPILLFALTMMQPDLSSTMMLVFIVSVLLFLGGLRKRYFFFAFTVGALIVKLIIKPYQMQRLTDFVYNLLPGYQGGEWPYQQTQGFIALVRGGFMGGGLGQGCQTMRYLPESHNDFIMAIVGEELGWFGATAVILAFLILLYRGVLICKAQPDNFGFLLGAGLLCSLVMYAFVNIGVNVGLLPITGLPLPFISAGGTSLILSLWSVGVLWRLSRRIKSND